MRIAITHPYSWPEVRRGAERIIMEMSEALAGRGHDVTVLTSGRRASRRRVGGVRIVRYRRLFEQPGRHQHWFGRRVALPLLLGRYDVVHSMAPWDAATSIAVSRITGHRTVYEDLGNPVRDKVERSRDRAARERVIRDVDVYACMSEFSRGFLRDDWGRDGSIIPGGVRLAQYEPRERHAEPTILFAGAVDRPEKCVRELLEAVAVLAERRPGVRLLLSGPGEASGLLATAPAAARERTAVLPLGEPHELAEQYARAWTTCLPTLWDSFGLVVIESMASGTPVTVGPAGAPPEVVRPSVGTVAASLKPGDLADALDRSLELAERHGTVGACREVAARYDWDGSVAALVEELYAEGEPGRSPVAPVPRFRAAAATARRTRGRVRRAAQRARRWARARLSDVPKLGDDHVVDLNRRYSGHPASGHTHWTPERQRHGLKLPDFRSDNLYVWQRGTSATAYRRSWAYALEHCRPELTATLREDGSFGVTTETVDGARVSRDLVDSVLELDFLAEHVPGFAQRPGFSVLDVGAGYGRLAHRGTTVYPHLRWQCIDAVPISTAICRYHLDQVGSPASVVELDRFDDLVPVGSIDLAVNVHSFNECSAAAIGWWASELARRRVPWLFVVPNDSQWLLSTEHDGTKQDYEPVLREHGYVLEVVRDKYVHDAEVQRVGVYPERYALFELDR